MSQSQQQERQNNLVNYCEKLSQLNVSKTSKRGVAQYKPILLLSVFDLITQGIIQDNRIYVSDELVKTFKKYWNVLASKYKGGLHYPFFHLQSEGFWHVELQDDFNGLQPKSLKKLKQAVKYATLDDELFNLLQDLNSREELISTLISVWFSASQSDIDEIVSINQDFQEVTQQEDLETKKSREIKPKFSFKKSAIRNSFFGKMVVHLYNYECAFCRLKVTKALTQNVVDGAHIKPFAKFHDNNVDNGISFCKNHHWAFDKGLFSINDDFKIVVSNSFKEESPNAKAIKEFHGESLLLPTSAKYYPNLEAIQWHRNNIFRS